MLNLDAVAKRREKLHLMHFTQIIQLMTILTTRKSDFWSHMLCRKSVKFADQPVPPTYLL